MKNLLKFSVVTLSLICSNFALAAEIGLSSGDSIVVTPNSPTRVTCNGGVSGGSDCSQQIKGLIILIEACKTSYSASSCAEKYWPSFKQSNPQCGMAALTICLDNCKTSYSASSCADKCNR